MTHESDNPLRGQPLDFVGDDPSTWPGSLRRLGSGLPEKVRPEIDDRILTELRKLPEEKPSRTIGRHRARFVYSGAAAAILVGIGLFVWLGRDTGPSPVPPDGRAVVLYRLGSVRTSVGEVRAGQVVPQGDWLTVGARSFAELQVMETVAPVVVRLYPGARLRIRGTIVADQPTFDHEVVGRILIRAGPLGNRQALRVRGINAWASVRGTAFEFQTSPGETRLEVHEGSVSIAPVLPDLARLPEAVIRQVPALLRVRGLLERQNVVIATGRRAEAPQTFADGILRAAPELQKALELAEVRGLREGRAAGPDAERAAVLALLRDLPPEQTDALVGQVESYVRTTPFAKVTDIGEATLQEKLREYQELVAVEGIAVLPSERRERQIEDANRRRRAVIMRRIEKIFGRRSETLVLKDGRRLSGIVIHRGESYLLLTPEGSREFSGAQVERIDF